MLIWQELKRKQFTTDNYPITLASQRKLGSSKNGKTIFRIHLS
jgi:hypothetical protein